MVLINNRYDVTLTPHNHTQQDIYQSSQHQGCPDIDCVLQKNNIMKGHGLPCWQVIGHDLNMNGAFGLPQLDKKNYEKVLNFCGPITGLVNSNGATWYVDNFHSNIDNKK